MRTAPLALTLALWACGEAEPPPPATAPTPSPSPTTSPDPTPVPVAHFAADPPVDGGPRLWIEATLDDHEQATVEVHAAGLGRVLGYALHVEADPRHLALDALEPTAALGEDTPGEAVYLAAERPGRAVLGAARRQRDAVSLDAPQIVARLRATPRDAATSRLALARVWIRGVDGARVVPALAGGALTTVGGAR